MNRRDRFVMSHKPFAIDLTTLTGGQQPRGDRWSFHGSVTAVWYRRKNGITRACIGSLKLFSHYLPEPLDLQDPTAVLQADLDGRYGGDCHGRWDGTRYWGAQEPFRQALHLTVLEPMLAECPTSPAGFDGWWSYR
jgi:hypothetical protein